MREIAVMRKLNHENCIKLHEVIDDEQEKLLYLGFTILYKLKISNKLFNAIWKLNLNIFCSFRFG